MMEIVPDFSEATNAKLETRYIINYYSIGAINCFTSEPNPKLYLRGHNLLDWTEATLLGYIANRNEDRFKDLRNEFIEQKSKIPLGKVLANDSIYLNLLYKYNLKRYNLIRLLLSRYNLDQYKNRVVVKD